MKHYAEIIKMLEESKKSTWHILHFMLTIVFFPWVVVWLLCTYINNQHNKTVDVEIAKVYHKMNQSKKEEGETL